MDNSVRCKLKNPVVSLRKLQISAEGVVSLPGETTSEKIPSDEREPNTPGDANPIETIDLEDDLESKIQAFSISVSELKKSNKNLPYKLNDVQVHVQREDYGSLTKQVDKHLSRRKNKLKNSVEKEQLPKFPSKSRTEISKAAEDSRSSDSLKEANVSSQKHTKLNALVQKLSENVNSAGKLIAKEAKDKLIVSGSGRKRVMDKLERESNQKKHLKKIDFDVEKNKRFDSTKIIKRRLRQKDNKSDVQESELPRTSKRLCRPTEKKQNPLPEEESSTSEESETEVAPVTKIGVKRKRSKLNQRFSRDRATVSPRLLRSTKTEESKDIKKIENSPKRRKLTQYVQQKDVREEKDKVKQNAKVIRLEKSVSKEECSEKSIVSSKKPNKNIEKVSNGNDQEYTEESGGGGNKDMVNHKPNKVTSPIRTRRPAVQKVMKMPYENISTPKALSQNLALATEVYSELFKYTNAIKLPSKMWSAHKDPRGAFVCFVRLSERSSAKSLIVLKALTFRLSGVPIVHVLNEKIMLPNPEKEVRSVQHTSNFLQRLERLTVCDGTKTPNGFGRSDSCELYTDKSGVLSFVCKHCVHKQKCIDFQSNSL